MVVVVSGCIRERYHQPENLGLADNGYCQISPRVRQANAPEFLGNSSNFRVNAIPISLIYLFAHNKGNLSPFLCPYG